MTKKTPRISPITGLPVARRGFAAMDPAKRKAIAQKGGGSVPAEKRAFHKDRKLAASAGSKGGTISAGGGRRRRTALQEVLALATKA
jgi:general stress protein YciG